jgi:serine/threonine protein kinase
LLGVSFLHRQGIIHRDIKGANILTTRKGEVKLADFGVSVFLEEGAISSVAGTAYWMAPEIIELRGACEESDIWSLGCTVIELLTGYPPYFHMAPMPAMYAIVQNDLPPFPEGLSDALQDFLNKTFQKYIPNRGKAEDLLKHPFIKQALNKKQESLDSAVQCIQLREEKKKKKKEKKDHAPKVKQKEFGIMPVLMKPSKVDLSRFQDSELEANFSDFFEPMDVVISSEQVQRYGGPKGPLEPFLKAAAQGDDSDGDWESAFEDAEKFSFEDAKEPLLKSQRVYLLLEPYSINSRRTSACFSFQPGFS